MRHKRKGHALHRRYGRSHKHMLRAIPGRSPEDLVARIQQHARAEMAAEARGDSAGAHSARAKRAKDERSLLRWTRAISKM